MIVKMTTLSTGLRVITARIPGMESATVAAFVRAGNRNENKEENGIAHFLEHMAFKGTARRSSLQIASEVEILGSDINAYTSNDVTAFYVKGLRETVETSVDIIGDVLSNSTFVPEELEIERGVILQEISRSKDNPNDVCFEGLSGLAYPDQALGRTILGPTENIESFTRDNFVSFVDRYYTAENMIVVCVSDIEHNHFEDMVAKHFSGVRRGIAAPFEPAQYQGGLLVNRSPKFEQVTSVFSWNSVSLLDDDYYSHYLFGSSIGGGMSSPLFQEIREKRGLVYTVSAATECAIDHGYLYMYAGTGPELMEELVSVALNLFNNPGDYITENDIQRAKNSQLVAIALIAERPFGLAQYLANSMFNRGKIILPVEKKERIMKVTKDDMIKASEVIFKSKPAISIVGPVENVSYLDKILQG